MSEKEKDVNQVVRYLTSTFNAATSKLERPFRGKNTGANQLYKWQTEFAYRLNEVMVAPRALLQANIARCNEYIDEVISSINQQQEQAESTKN